MPLATDRGGKKEMTDPQIERVTVYALNYYKLNEDAEQDTRFDPESPLYFDDEDCTRFAIGIFSTREKAEKTIRELCDKPGFRRDVRGFRIEPYALDSVLWEDGFHRYVEGALVEDETQ